MVNGNTIYNRSIRSFGRPFPLSQTKQESGIMKKFPGSFFSSWKSVEAINLVFPNISHSLWWKFRCKFRGKPQKNLEKIVENCQHDSEIRILAGGNVGKRLNSFCNAIPQQHSEHQLRQYSHSTDTAAEKDLILSGI